MRRRHPWFLPCLLLAACSSDHPLAGGWGQQLPGNAHGMVLEFELGGQRVTVHAAPRPDGTHDHVEGVTYAWDAAAKSITVRGPLLGAGKGDTWSGRVEGDRMELGAAEGKLVFQRGAKALGH